LVVISQSCDIVRSHEERPYVQVAALSPATHEELNLAEARTRPRYGYLEALRPLGLIVDFDITVTVAKITVAGWQRNQGCTTDEEQRDFALALARHKQRFAFPDDFNLALKPLRRWIERRSEKLNAAGEMLRAIEQIRVRCADWSDPEDLEFIAVLIGDPDIARRQSWDAPCGEMAKTVQSTYSKSTFRLASWQELSAEDYLRSDRLDLDGLSDA
jgi:hypothetical protein